MADSAHQSDESSISGEGLELQEVEPLPLDDEEEVTEPGLHARRVSAPPPIPPEARQSRVSGAPPSASVRPTSPGSEPAFAYRPLPPPPARSGSAPPSSGLYVIDPRALPPLPARSGSATQVPVPAPRSAFAGISREDATQPRYQPDLHRLEARVRELEAKLRLRDDLITELERSLKEQRRRVTEADAEVERLRSAPPQADDLKRIHGIGKGFEQKLRALGVTSVEHVAAWTSSDVASMAEALGIQASRIERDGWIASAKALLEKR